MLIRTRKNGQIDDCLVNACKVYISYVLGKNKGALSAQFAGNGFLAENSVLIGLFPTQADAAKELDNIQKFFAENPNGIYEVNQGAN